MTYIDSTVLHKLEIERGYRYLRSYPVFSGPLEWDKLEDHISDLGDDYLALMLASRDDEDFWNKLRSLITENRISTLKDWLDEETLRLGFAGVLLDTPCKDFDRNVYGALVEQSFEGADSDEISNMLVRLLLPYDHDFFAELEAEIIEDMVANGVLDIEWAAKSFSCDSEVARRYQSMV